VIAAMVVVVDERVDLGLEVARRRCHVGEFYLSIEPVCRDRLLRNQWLTPVLIDPKRPRNRLYLANVTMPIFKPIWLGDERRKALIFRHAGCERPAQFDESGGYENAHVK
jgi:hypothetical protein